jgi:cytochrome c551/c552
VTPGAAPASAAETGAPGAAITDTVVAAGDSLTATLPISDAVAANLLPVDMVAALASADPVHGQELTVANGCIACHALGEGQQLVGPSWFGIGAHAATRVAGESAEAYLYRSIVAPNDHVVEGFVAGIMPPVYGDTIPAPDLADIISYLLSLQ